jgi:transforming growth factor-beta-induced protein
VEDDATVAGFIASNPNLTQLNRAVQRAELTGIISSNTSMFTQFASTDAAFAAIPEIFLFLLFENDEFLPHLRNLITYNRLMGQFFEADFIAGDIQTFNGETVQVTLNPLSVNGIPITDPDNDVSNGVVHIFGDVLTPSWVLRTLLTRVEQDPDLSITTEFLVLAGIGPALNQAASGNFTLLAPTNTAWLALGNETLLFLSDPANVGFLQSVLRYHILDGVFVLQELVPSRIFTFQGNFVTVSLTPRIQFNQAQLVDGGRDILANNGVLQKIDSVLEFQAGDSDTVQGGDGDTIQGADSDTVLDFIAEAPEFSLFFEGLQRGGLTAGLAVDEDTLTVFAPTNAAFNVLPQALRELLFLSDEFIVHLQSLLLYHVLPQQTIASEDFVNDSNLQTANGEFVNILTNPLTVNERPVRFTDIRATNGFTDVIGGVLLPSWVFNTLASRIANDPELTKLKELLELGGVDVSIEGANLTLLAPTNAAWNALGSERLQELQSTENRAELLQILAYHLGTSIFAFNGEPGVGFQITTFQGGNTTGVVTVTSNNPNITLNGVDNALSPAVLLVPNILAANGVLHTIDAVLDPLDSRP